MTNDSSKKDVGHKLSAVGWGLFFIWIGAAMLYDFNPGTTALGIGAIILLAQMIRFLFKLKLEGFWVVVGLAFLVGGTWQTVDMQIDLVPILLVIAGVAILSKAFWRKHN